MALTHMLRVLLLLVVVPSLLMGVGYGTATIMAPGAEHAAPAEPAPVAAAPALPEEIHHVAIGALTFSIEDARHTVYVVSRFTAGFADAATAEKYMIPENIVRLRDAALVAVADGRVLLSQDGGVNEAALQTQLDRQMARAYPEVAEMRAELIGVRQVPRR